MIRFAKLKKFKFKNKISGRELPSRDRKKPNT